MNFTVQCRLYSKSRTEKKINFKKGRLTVERSLALFKTIA